MYVTVQAPINQHARLYFQYNYYNIEVKYQDI